MPTNKNTSRPVKTAERTFEILQHIRKENGGTPTEIARSLGTSKSTIHRYLVTLEDNNYLIKRDERYYLSLRFLNLGIQAREYIPMDHVIPKVSKIAEQTGEVVWFVTEEAGECVYLHGESGQNSIISGGRIGLRNPMHSHASGKALLSQLPDKRVHEILDEHGLPALTDRTITDRATLFEELEQVAQQGIAYNRSESVDGINAVSSPVTAGNSPIGAVTIVGPSNRLKGSYLNSDLVDLLREVTNELEVNISFSN